MEISTEGRAIQVTVWFAAIDYVGEVKNIRNVGFNQSASSLGKL